MPNDNKNTIVIEAKWTKNKPDTHIPLKVQIINNTDNIYISPEISFDVSNINYSHEAGIRAYSGFKQKNTDGDIITGKLSGTKKYLDAHSEVSLLFDFKLSDDQYPELPKQFWFNHEEMSTELNTVGHCRDLSCEYLTTFDFL